MNQPVYLDMTQYKRLKHFEYFKTLAYPYVGTTCEIEVTAFYQWVKDNHLPFFLSFLWCVAQAANEVPEFRQRISGDQIAEYPFCSTSHTVSKDDETYAYCALDCRKSFNEFIVYGKSQQEQAKLYGNIDERHSETQSFLFISTVPWMTYTSVVLPVPMPADSNPRITWGKFQSKEGVLNMPVSVLCNHALIDGKHIGDFYEALKEKMDSLIKMPLETVVFYHGTKADLKVGEMLEPGRNSNYGEGKKANYVYLTATLEAAVWGAELGIGEGSGRIYIVEPLGAIEDDPNLTDKKFYGNPTKSYRSKGALKVVGEVTQWEGHAPEVLKQMRDRLEELKNLGIEAINE